MIHVPLNSPLLYETPFLIMKNTAILAKNEQKIKCSAKVTTVDACIVLDFDKSNFTGRDFVLGD